MRRDAINGLGMGLIHHCGASRAQEMHLDFLGIPLAPAHDVVGGEPRRFLLPGMDPKGDEYRATIDGLLLSGLRDRSEQRMREIYRHLSGNVAHGKPGCTSTRIDDVSMALLEDMGVSPAWLLVLSALQEGDEFMITLADRGAHEREYDITVRQKQDDEEPILEIQIHLGNRVHWTGEGVRFPGDPSSTIMSATLGMPLREVVSHPILDRFELSVRSTDDRWHQFNVGYVPYRALSWGEELPNAA